VGIRSLVAMALCALLALLAFLGFLVLMASSRGAWVILGLAAVLACPVIWLSILRADSKSWALDPWVGTQWRDGGPRRIQK
jgi:hypothetical protein